MNDLLRILSRSTVAALCLLLVATPAIVACDDDDDDEAAEEQTQGDDGDEAEADDDDDEGNEQSGVTGSAPDELAEAFPADAVGIVTTASLGDIQSLSEDLIATDAIDDDTRAQWEELLVAAREELKADAGIDLFDPDIFDELGLDPDGQLHAGFLPAPVVCVGVQDDWDFHDFAVHLYDDGEDVDIEEEQVDGHDLYLVDDEAWARHGDAACGAADHEGEEARDTLVAFLDGPGDGNSIADSEDFQQFVDSGLADGIITFYSEDDTAVDELAALAGPGAGMLLGDLIGGQGGAITVENDVLKVRGWTGLDSATAEMVQGVVTPDHNFEWSRFATQDTGTALRLSLNPEQIWSHLSGFVEDEVDAMTEEVVADADDVDIDLETSIIENLSGHVGIFGYDLPDPMAMMMADPADLGDQMEVLFAVHFIDDEPLGELFDDLQVLLEAEPTVDYRSYDDDIDIIAIDDVEANVYYYDDVVTVATTGIGDDKVAAMLRGDLADESLGATGSPLGAALEDDAFNGLYFGGGLWSYIGNAVEMPELDEHFDEVLIRVDADDAGVSLGVDVYPAGSAIFGLTHIAMVTGAADTAEEVVYEEVVAPPAP